MGIQRGITHGNREAEADDDHRQGADERAFLEKRRKPAVAIRVLDLLDDGLDVPAVRLFGKTATTFLEHTILRGLGQALDVLLVVAAHDKDEKHCTRAGDADKQALGKDERAKKDTEGRTKRHAKRLSERVIADALTQSLAR